MSFTKKYPCGTGKFKDIVGVFSSVFLYRGILIAGFYCNTTEQNHEAISAVQATDTMKVAQDKQPLLHLALQKESTKLIQSDSCQKDECLHLSDMVFYGNEDTDSNNDCFQQEKPKEHPQKTIAKTTELKQKDIERYKLWHQRCVHAGPEVIRNLHKRTTLDKVKVPTDKETCITCKLAKMRKKISKELSPWKETILALIYADIAGPFYTSLQGNQYMAKLVDSASRLVWIILGKDRKDIVRKLRNWKKLVEKQSDLKLMGV